MALSATLCIVILFHCLKVIDGAPMPFWRHRAAYGAQCNKYGNRCDRDNDCWCENEDLRCKFVFLKGGKECMAENDNEIAMFYRTTSAPTTEPHLMCFKYQHQCYHDNDCKCEYDEYLHCKQFFMDIEGLCLTEGEDFPWWFTPRPPTTPTTFKPPTTTSLNPMTTPTSPATATSIPLWQCENLDAICEEDTDCLCEHSDELRCTYDPEMQERYCIPEEWDPTEHPPTTHQTPPPTTHQTPLPTTERCEMYGAHCSSDTDCFCEELNNLRCAYAHETKQHLCLQDDWNQGGYSKPTTPELPPTKTNPPPKSKLSPTSNTPPFIDTNPSTKELPKNKSISISKRPWNPSKFGTGAPDDGGSGEGETSHTKIPPTTKSPWNIWGTKTVSVGKKKGGHILLTSYRKLMLNVPVQSLHEVINELEEKKLIK